MLLRFFLVICSVFAFVEWHTADTLFYFSCVCAKCAGFGLGIVFDANRSLGDFERTRRKKLGVNEMRQIMKFEKIVLLGATWGLLQTGLFLLAGYVTLLAGNSLWAMLQFGAMLQLAILTSAAISALVGYRATSVRSALVALLLAQVVGFFSFFLLGSLRAPDLLAPFSLYLIGFGLLLFFVGVIGSFVGAYFREYFQPPRTRMVGWKFLSLGLLTAGVAAMLPLYPYSSDVSPVGLWGSTLPIIPFIGGLVFAGLVSMVFGFRRTRDLDSERVGLMVVAGLIVFGLSLISIGLTYGASLTPPCHRSCQDFQLISALLASSLLISSGAIVACLVSDQKEGVAELIDNRGSSARTRQP